MTLSAAETHKLKHAPATEEVLPVMRTRWSPRSFSDREVSSAHLRKVFEAARWAPSSNNDQPWRFIIGWRKSDTFQKIASSLLSFNQAWAPNAPILILGIARKQFSHNNAPNNFALFDLGAATGFITLQAAELGLSTHQMAGYDQDVARKALQVPDEFALGSVIALGYQGEPSSLPSGKLLESETSPRSRKPLTEIVLSAWGEPAKLG